MTLPEIQLDQPTPSPKPTNAEKDIPDSAQVVIVPVANPATAPTLLNLATALTGKDNGRVIALMISKDSTFEEESASVNALTPIIENLQVDGNHIELMTITATSIARGILDTAREEGADLIILGIAKPTHGDVILGTIVENVVTTAPCDVLIYRQGLGKDVTIKRVILPTNGSVESQVAARTGIRLANQMETRIEAMFAQGSHRPQYEGLAYIEKTLAQCPGSQRVKRTVVLAYNPAQGMLSRMTDEDMVIVGFTQRSELERWMFGDLTRDLLNQATGPVVLVARSVGQNTPVKRWSRRVLGWIRPTLTRIEQEDVVRTARTMASFNIDYWVLIMVSAVIATLGLLLNSGAVIIGAMLVAPLMQPLIGISVGVTIGNLRILQTAVPTLLIGVFSALGLAFVIGLLTPIDIITPEMAGRGNPSLLDAGVALASGIVGAYATARKDIPSALAGVAIAAALVPPLCTVGLGIGIDDSDLAFGAGVLFVTNIISIILAGAIVFSWMGLTPDRQDDTSKRRSVISITSSIIITIPVVLILLFLSTRATKDSRIQDHLAEALKPAELYDITFDTTSNPIRVLGFVRTAEDITAERVAELEVQVEGEVGEEIDLELVIQRIIRAPVVELDSVLDIIESTSEPESTDTP